MGDGDSRTRAKLFAGLAVLAAVWGFAAFASGSDAARLLQACLVIGLGLIGGVWLLVMTLRASRTRRIPGATESVARLDAPVAGVPGTARTAGSGHGIDDDDPDGRPRGEELYELILDLNRRNQALLHRQLRVLDAMERRESNDEDLGDLFRADHLATRVRRNVEKLIALAGGAPARRWHRPVPMVDVVRAAVAEVAEYTRVAASEIEPAVLAGEVVTDVSHLLAELIENATLFAPAQTRVRVTGQPVPNGYLITVIDSGPGMSGDDLATAHQVLAEPDPPGGGAWWGLYAVGRLADRHGITVTLRKLTADGSSAEGPATEGLAAEVLIPPILLTTSMAGEAPSTADDTQDILGAVGITGEKNVMGGGSDGAADAAPHGTVRRTASGLPTRTRNVIDPAPASRRRRSASTSGSGDLSANRVARLSKRAGVTDTTVELSSTSGDPEHTALDQQSTVGQPGRKRS